MYNYDFDLPDFDNISEEELLAKAHTDGIVPNVNARAQIIKILYEVLGYNLEPDLMYFLVDETEKQLGLAPAGGGKTTTMCIKIILQQLWRKIEEEGGEGKTHRLIRPNEIVCLVYNKANIADVQNRHAELVYQLKNSKIKGLEGLKPGIKVCTVHSFCQEWVEEYRAYLGLVGFNLMSDESSKLNLMTSAVRVNCKKNPSVKQENVSPNRLLELYNYLRERMLPYGEMVNTDKFVDLNLPVEFIQDCFNAYDKVKKMKKQFDFTDSLTKFYELVSEHEDARERIKSNYKYFTADEVQDLTPIIMEIIKLMTDDKPLVCIGDEDQCVYSFRGANPKNVLEFQNIFPKSKVFLLRTNRRCPEEIVDLARKVISLNQNRFPKDIRSIKSGGSIVFKSYRDRVTQFENVVKIINDMSESERNSTCISYRNSVSCVTIADEFIKRGIHFHILKGLNPFDYPLYTAVRDVMGALSTSFSKKALCNLYKALPVTRAEMAKFVGYDLEKDKPIDGKDFIKMEEIDFGKRGLSAGLKNAWKLLLYIRDNMRVMPLNKYFPALLQNIRDYYWNFRVLNENKDKQVDSVMQESVMNFFMSNKTYAEKNDEYESKLRTIRRDGLNYNGVALSTFHSQKGLEWDNVIMTDLQESIFPQTALIESKGYSEEDTTELIETELRLFYVAITRAKKKLWMFYSYDDPTSYVTYLMDYCKSKDDEVKESVNTVANVDKIDFQETPNTSDEDSDLIEIELEDEEDEDSVLIFEESEPNKITADKVIIKEPLSNEKKEVVNDSAHFKGLLQRRFLR